MTEASIIHLSEAAGGAVDRTLPAAPMELRRIDPSRNMSRFYRLDVVSDLFGGFLLMKQWGRIGTRGRVVAERHDSRAVAIHALHELAKRKKRRGYV